MEEILEIRSSLAAPFIFLLAVILQLISSFIANLKKADEKWLVTEYPPLVQFSVPLIRVSVNAEEIQLRQEIKELLKEASSLSNPSTFAQAAKLRRKAAAKEKELRKSQELHNKEKKLPYAMCVKCLMGVKVVSYLLLVVWFWGKPVAVVSQQLLQPFGKIVSWRAGDTANSHIMVGIIPWLIISNRVSGYICQKLTK